MDHTISRDNVTLHYSVHDYTDPWKASSVLILQHGLSRSSQIWRGMIPYLSRFYRVVCPDLRGHGASSKDFDAREGITIPNFIADILAIADAVGARDFHYAGESMGGIIGIALAAERPDKVRTLSVMATPMVINPWIQDTLSFGYKNWEEALNAMGSKGWAIALNSLPARVPPDTDPALIEWYADQADKASADVLINMFRIASTIDSSQTLKRVKAPVLGIYPHGSKLAPDEQQQALLGNAADVRLVRLPFPYHMVWMVAPAACAKHILHFMAARDGIAAHE